MSPGLLRSPSQWVEGTNAEACNPALATLQCTQEVAGDLLCRCPTIVNPDNAEANAEVQSTASEYDGMMCGSPSPCDCGEPSGATCVDDPGSGAGICAVIQLAAVASSNEDECPWTPLQPLMATTQEVGRLRVRSGNILFVDRTVAWH